MKMHLIATIRDSKDNIVGFRILDSDTMKVVDQPKDKVAHVLANNIAPIIGMEFKDGDIKGTNGVLDRYPKLNENFKPLSNEMVILGQFFNGDGGYLVANIMGKTTTGSREDLVAKAKQIGLANGKIVTNNYGDDFLSAINGRYEELDGEKYGIKKKEIAVAAAFDTFGQKEKQSEEEMNKATNANLNVLQKLVNQRGNLYISRASLRRYIPGNTVLASESHFKDVIGIVDGKEITAEDKLISVMIGIKYVKPLYYCLLTRMKRQETTDVPTMAVSATTLYFNSQFIKERPIQELTFTVLHELTHVALQHVARMGNRDPQIWNFATDLFVNKSIYDNFGLNGLETIYLDVDGKKIPEGSSYQRYLSIAMPDGFLFSPNVDINTDTPESIYEILIQENQDNDDQQDQNGDSQDNGESGDGQQQSGNGQSQGGGQQQDGDGQGQDGDGQSGQGDSQPGQGGGSQGKGKGQPSQGSGQGGNGDGEPSEDGDEQGQGNGAGNGAEGGSSGAGNSKPGQGQRKQRKKIKFRGKEYDVSNDFIAEDMVDDSESKGKSPETIKQESKSLLSSAIQSLKQSNQYSNSGSSDLLRQIEMQLAPKISWRKILKNFFVMSTQKVNTFSAPDKRFRTRDMIIPGPKPLDLDSLDTVWICIDTSGSVGDSEIGEIYTQVDSLLRKYKTDAEVIFWDTKVKSVSSLKNYKNARELIKVKPVGGGGTDPSCIFEYYKNDRDLKIGRKHKPSLILIFTDGYFSERDIMKYKSKFKNVVWVIHDNDRFKAPFGKVAPFVID